MSGMQKIHQVVMLCALVVVACGDGSTGEMRPFADDASSNGPTERPARPATTTTTPPPPPPPPPELPRGGREIFPAFRVVAHYGGATTWKLGILGETAPEEAAARVEAAAAPF